MLLSLKWLREFTPYQGTDEDLADRLTMLGLEVEEIVRPFAHLNGIVVGHVIECDRHPEADKLSVCRVDVAGPEALSIVCGAPNVAKGQKVAVALVGATLPGGLTIKKAKLRGVASHGMICAEDELGLGDSHSGIMVLDTGHAPGTPLLQALDLDDVVFDVGVTPNRADCLSVLGVAREVAMTFGLPLTMPSFEISESGPDASTLFAVEIDEPALCPVYQGRVVTGITVGPAPDRMRWRLMAIGQRPISNIVDITNYVLFELGQPLHAFDMDLLHGGKIRVGRASTGMTLTTLDGQNRVLDDRDLLIWDGVKPVALAGVMGGANSEINAASANVFLESAVFNAASIRRTARRLALPSEASYRFERGVDQINSRFAMNRAVALIAQHAGGSAHPGMALAEPLPWRERTIRFRPAKAAQLLGVDLTDLFCRATVTGMGCRIASEGQELGNTVWELTAPSCRLDLEREVDVTEELGRVYGMDRVPATLPRIDRSAVAQAVEDPRAPKVDEYFFWRRVREWARGAGLREAINYSFVGQKDLDLLGLPTEGRIPVKNPLSEEQDVLRPALAPGLLQNLRHNIAQGADRVRLFELAHVFHANAASETTASEPGRLGLLLYGPRNAERWPLDQSDADYQDVKGLVEHLGRTFRLVEPGEEPRFALVTEHAWLNPCVEVFVGGSKLGELGRVKPEIADRHHARKDVWVAELDAGLVEELSRQARIRFQALPTYPSSWRDVTIIAPPALPVGAILGQVRSQKRPLLEMITLVDVFTPDSGEDLDRRLTFRLTFRSPDKTLKDKDVDKEMQKMSESLQGALPVRF